jgi:two-component system, NtrC family, sensor histidine kinase KinB
MKLRTRLLLAQGPLALALALVGVSAVATLADLGKSGQRILADNYRSVLAAQRMKESIERIDSAALFLVIGEDARGLRQAAENRPRFESELRAEEENITEPGEKEAAVGLRQNWTDYQRAFDTFVQLSSMEQRRERYLSVLSPTFVRVKDNADTILAINQDAMVERSEQQRRKAEVAKTLTLVAVLVALLAGLLASGALVARALRPVAVLGQAVRRVGEGDLDARVRVADSGEIGQLAHDFNAMADSLRSYRQSSLGELLQAQASAQAAIDTLPDPVLVFGADGSLLNANRIAESLLGVRLDADAPLAPMPPEVRAVVDTVRNHVLSEESPYVPRGFDEAVLVSSPEGAMALLPRASPVLGEGGGVLGVTVVLQDVTRLRRFDELKNDLVATVAHEFRTPLTSLRMAIHLCVEGAVGPVTEKQLDLLYSARDDCERLQRIVDDLLDLARIRAGLLELNPGPVEVSPLLEQALAGVRSAAEQGGVKLDMHLEPGAESLVADKERLALALQNLLSNAVRHTSSGGSVTLSAAPDEEGLRFSVRDTGEGIAPEYLPRLFDRFFRVPGGHGGSAGLGLSIVKDVAEAHGGRAGAESVLGRGSTFWLTVPTAARGAKSALAHAGFEPPRPQGAAKAEG